MNASITAEREISITRIFNAPRELVFKVWTDPNHIDKWWGPDGFTNTIQEMNVKPKGTWRFIMHGPDGTDYPNLITYHEVVKPSLLTFSHGDFSGPWFEVRVEFREKGKQTEIMMQMVFPTKEARDEVVEKFHAIEGNKQTMDKLEKYLATLN